MKKIFSLLVLGFLVGFGSPSAFAAQTATQAQSYYGEFSLAGALPENSDIKGFKGSSGQTRKVEVAFDDAFMFDMAVGYDFGPIRVDGSFGYADMGFTSAQDEAIFHEGAGSFDVMALLANAYYDFETKSPIKPYLGGGIGLARLRMDVPASASLFSGQDEALVFAYQVTAGIGYQLNNQLATTLSYRYFGTEEGELNGSSRLYNRAEDMKLRYGAHQLRFGLRFWF